MNSAKKYKTIYILGHSRSGSTILNILLGNIDSVFAAGEINNYLKSGWMNDHYCSCGNPVSKCEFWPRVRESLERSMQPDPEKLIHSSQQLENWRHLLKARLPTTKEHDTAKNEYIHFNSELIKSISKIGKADWVVDASKSPIRLHYLLQSTDLNCAAIHIVRDPRGVCWSLMKPAPKNVEAGVQVDLPSTPYLVTVKNLYINAISSSLVKRKIPSRHISIRYDDLINSSIDTVTQIGTLLETDTTSVLKIIESNQNLQQEHNVAGNRLRMKSSITLKYDQSWKKELSNIQFIMITVLTVPLLLIYRFPLGRR